MSESIIVDVIKDEALEASVNIVKDAQNKAKQMLADEELMIEKRKSEYDKKFEADAQALIESAHPAGEIIVRNAVLSAKRKQIDKTINLMLAKLMSLSTEEYFMCVHKMILANKHEEKGVLIFNARDKGRIPRDFMNGLENLELSAECAAISGGVILDYGDVCEDLSFHALINEKYDELVDVVNKELFKKAEA